MRKVSSSYIVFAVMIVLTMLLSSCAAKVKTVEVEKVVQQTVEVQKVVQATVEVEKVVQQTVQVLITPTSVPATATAVPVAYGTADNPIIMALAPSATSQDLQTGGQAIADELSKITGSRIVAMSFCEPRS